MSDPSPKKDTLAARAAARRQERYRRGCQTRELSTERGKLLAWFALQPTSALREYQVAILKTQQQQRQRGLKMAAMKRAQTLQEKRKRQLQEYARRAAP
jgi:L-amino acid N-acyltransferase YncA